MDFDVIRRGLETGVPFNAHVGLQGLLVERGHAIVGLPEADHLRNHIGTQHGSAIFAAAEAASGTAVFGAFIDHMARFTPLAERGEIAFTAVARGALAAEAHVTGDVEALVEVADREGGVRFDASVQVRDSAGKEVAFASFHWLLRRNEAPQDWTRLAEQSYS